MKVETLTPVERLQLANQFAILEKLYHPNGEHFAKNRKILEDGYTLLYEQVFPGDREEMSLDDCPVRL